MRQLRSMAAAAVSTTTRGQGATTLLWLYLGPESDPYLKCCIDQLCMWIHLLELCGTRSHSQSLVEGQGGNYHQSALLGHGTWTIPSPYAPLLGSYANWLLGFRSQSWC